MFRIYWRQKSQGKPKVSPETISLIQKIAKENHLWGAERIRGELLKLGIQVSKRTIQKYMPKKRESHSSSPIVPMPLRETWANFLKNQAGDIWACDFTVVYDWLFRQWYIFVVMELKTRRIVHMGVTKYPTDEWTVQQLREATRWGRGPKYLIRDRDSKYATHFSAMAISSGIQELKTPCRTPQANGICERFMGSLRRECLDQILFHDGGMYSGWSGNTRHTSITNDRIRVLASVFPHSIICRSQSRQVGESPRRQFLADCITAIRVRLI